MHFFVIILLSLPFLAVCTSAVPHLSTNLTDVEANTMHHLVKRGCPPADADIQKVVTPLLEKIRLGKTRRLTRACSCGELVT